MTNYEELKKIDFNHLNFYKNSLNPLNIMKLTKEEERYLTNPIKFNKSFLEHRFSFSIDESNLENNLFFHLLLNRDHGLTMHEICSLLGFIGRDKAIVRFLNNLEKKNYIKRSSIRKGKKFEYIYKLDETKTQVPDSIHRYVKFYQIRPKEDECKKTENEAINFNINNDICQKNKSPSNVLNKLMSSFGFP